jgi:acyl-CoA reductase-like NAD-dependent aldehyde dehydrogenase
MIDDSIPPAGSLDVTSPFDGSVLATVNTGGADYVDAALSAAYDLFRDRDKWLPAPERIAILERTGVLMEAQKDDLAKLAASEGGKPLQDSLVEVIRAIDGVHLCVETLRGHPGQVIPVATTPATLGRIAFTQKEPVGVVVAVRPAVATGCPVIVKPAADTPLSCLRFVELLREAGHPAAWCQAIVADSNETAEKLVTDSRVGFFSFIGSARIGWMLRSKLAPGTRCALEHGGAAPVILLDDFEFDTTLAAVLKGGFYHAGQVCVSVQRLFVPREQSRAFADALAKRANDLTVGDPTDQKTEVGPLIRPAEVERVAEWVDDAVAAGAKLLCGGKRMDNNCYAPTVLLDPPQDARVSTLEIFGPVICVYSYDDPNKAVAQANSLPTAFQAAVFGKDISRIMQMVRSLDASAVMVNDHSAFRDDVMPFAGLRESGLGIGGIPYTMHDMQTDKMMVINTSGD